MASCKKGTGTLIWPELKELGIHCLMYVAATFFNSGNFCFSFVSNSLAYITSYPKTWKKKSFLRFPEIFYNIYIKTIYAFKTMHLLSDISSICFWLDCQLQNKISQACKTSVIYVVGSLIFTSGHYKITHRDFKMDGGFNTSTWDEPRYHSDH